MNYREVLKNGCLAFRLKGSTKKGVIEEMVDMLAASGKLADRDEVLRSVFERESKMSTGMQCGVALPHGKTDAVKALVVAFGIKKEGVDFSSLDGLPSRIFVMTISPKNTTGPHMQYLAGISKLLNRPSVRDAILNATDSEEVIKILCE